MVSSLTSLSKLFAGSHAPKDLMVLSGRKAMHRQVVTHCKSWLQAVIVCASCAHSQCFQQPSGLEMSRQEERGL